MNSFVYANPLFTTMTSNNQQTHQNILTKIKENIKIVSSHNESNTPHLCSICLETNSNEFCKLPCNHVFHFKCVAKYFFMCKKTLCPMCRVDISTVNNINYHNSGTIPTNNMIIPILSDIINNNNVNINNMNNRLNENETNINNESTSSENTNNENANSENTSTENANSENTSTENTNSNQSEFNNRLQQMINLLDNSTEQDSTPQLSNLFANVPIRNSNILNNILSSIIQENTPVRNIRIHYSSNDSNNNDESTDNQQSTQQETSSSLPHINVDSSHYTQTSPPQPPQPPRIPPPRTPPSPTQQYTQQPRRYTWQRPTPTSLPQTYQQTELPTQSRYTHQSRPTQHSQPILIPLHLQSPSQVHTNNPHNISPIRIPIEFDIKINTIHSPINMNNHNLHNNNNNNIHSSNQNYSSYNNNNHYPTNSSLYHSYY